MDESALSFSVVAPMHHESGNIQVLYEEVREAMDKLGRSYEIIFVNDKSTDGTLRIMKRIVGTDPRFHYTDLESNVGENRALQAGSLDGVLEIPKLKGSPSSRRRTLTSLWRAACWKQGNTSG